MKNGESFQYRGKTLYAIPSFPSNGCGVDDLLGRTCVLLKKKRCTADDEVPRCSGIIFVSELTYLNLRLTE